MKNPKFIRVDHLLAYLIMYGGYTIIILFDVSCLCAFGMEGLLLATVLTIPLIIVYFIISNIAAAAADLRGKAIIVNTILLALLVTLCLIVFFEISAWRYKIYSLFP